MKERPILFSGPMVQAILNGTKNQTRRVVKAIALEWLDAGLTPDFVSHTDNDLCPYGLPGDVLWVRETFYAYGKWVKNGHSKTGKQQWRFIDLYDNGSYPDNDYKYMDGPPDDIKTGKSEVVGWYKRPSLFMPRSACRIRLQITDIRVERLQDISEEDARNEGVKFIRDGGNDGPIWEFEGYIDYLCPQGQSLMKSAKQSFQSLWQKINGPESWKQNPWVWVINFERI